MLRRVCLCEDGDAHWVVPVERRTSKVVIAAEPMGGVTRSAGETWPLVDLRRACGCTGDVGCRFNGLTAVRSAHHVRGTRRWTVCLRSSISSPPGDGEVKMCHFVETR